MLYNTADTRYRLQYFVRRHALRVESFDKRGKQLTEIGRNCIRSSRLPLECPFLHFPLPMLREYIDIGFVLLAYAFRGPYPAHNNQGRTVILMSENKSQQRSFLTELGMIPGRSSVRITDLRRIGIDLVLFISANFCFIFPTFPTT